MEKSEIIAVDIDIHFAGQNTKDTIDLTLSEEESETAQPNTDFTLEIGPKNVLAHDKDDIILKCCICDKIFLYVLNLVRHMVRHELKYGLEHTEPYSLCDICGLEIDHAKLKAHCGRFHDLTNITRYPSKIVLKKHRHHWRVDRSDYVMTKCGQCGDRFTDHIALEWHLWYAHKMFLRNESDEK